VHSFPNFAVRFAAVNPTVRPARQVTVRASWSTAKSSPVNPPAMFASDRPRLYRIGVPAGLDLGDHVAGAVGRISQDLHGAGDVVIGVQ
jgi:hypothetical protein